MKRIALILLLFVMLSPRPHFGRSEPLGPVALRVLAQPQLVPEQLAGRDYGPLRLTGLWSLQGDREAFGGLSALLVEPDGRFIGLADSGEAVVFRPGGEGVMAALPRLADDPREMRGKHDSESMTRDPITGRIWIGFERAQRICRYSPGLAAIEGCGSSPALQAWPEEGSVEALVRFGDGRFLAISERTSAR